MSSAVHEFLSPSSSSTQRSYLQNPNPSDQRHYTDSGTFDDSFNIINYCKLDFDCSNDTAAAAAAAAAAATVRSSRRKHVKAKKNSSCKKPVNSTADTIGFVFNATASGSVLNSSLGQTDCGGNSERKSDAEVLGFNALRFTMGDTNNSNLGQKMGSEQVRDSGNISQPGNLNFVFGADVKGDTVKGSERIANKFGKPNGVDFVFGATKNNGVDDSESGKTVASSGIDEFMKVKNFTTEADSHLVNSMSSLNLGSGGLGEAAPLLNNNCKAEENNQSDKRFENLDFVFSANHKDSRTDSSIRKQESKKKVDKLAPDGRGEMKFDAKLGLGSLGDSGTADEHLGKKDFGISSTEIKSGDSVNVNVDTGIMFGKSKVNGSCDYSKKQEDNKDSVLNGNYSFVFGSNLGNAFNDIPLPKVSHETKTSNFHDPTKASITTSKVNDFDGNSCSFSSNLFVFGSDKRDTSCGRSDTTSLNQFRGVNLAGFDEVNKTPTFEGKGKNDTGINMASSFTSDMFPGLGKKLEFSKTNSLSQRKSKKTKGKPKQQSRNCQKGAHTRSSEEVLQSFEESPGCCSPMDVSPYLGNDCTDPATSQVENEGADAPFSGADVAVRRRPNQKKYKMKTGRGIESTTQKSRVDVSHEHAKSTDQETCDKWRKRGNQAYKSGDLSEAEVCYSKGINSIQHNTVPPGDCIEPLLLCYSNRAATRMALGRLREGLMDCRMAAELDPSFMKVNLRSANCHLLLGEVEDASYYYNMCLESEKIVCLDRRIAIEAADGLQKSKKVADYLKLSTDLLQQKTYESATNALKTITDALSISCYSEKLLNLKGEALLMLGKHKDVVQLCEQTLVSAEKNGYECKIWRWNLMSRSYFHLGRLEKSLDLIEKHEQLKPQESLNHLAVTIRELLHFKKSGNEAFQSGKHTEAVEHYTAAISKSIESHAFAAVCFCNRAAAHQSLGEIIDAIGDCSIAIALDGSYSKALSRRATLLEMIRDYKHAADDLERLISILGVEKSGENSQTNGSVKDLRRARHRLSSVKEKSKNERGLKSSDVATDVKKAYRKAALRHHPDKAGQILARAESGSDGQKWKVISESIQMDADRLFKMIGEAYAVLSDSTKRSKYDLEEEMWDDMEVGSSNSRRRGSDFYSSPYETSNRRNSQESRKTYGNSHYYYWQEPGKTYHSSYPRW